MAELLQYPDGAAGAATAHDVQGEHEASSATRGPDVHQLSPPHATFPPSSSSPPPKLFC